VCDNGGAKKTAVLYRSSLSYDQLRRYLGLLSDQDLIYRKEDGHYQLTPRGQKTLRQMSSVMKALRD
jgi:predicted transcriptional regulator